ncbi:MAG TPA: hypothetical protein VFN11_22615 [Ktedonobacterales bacterium]|nr:hypothetical protein [Ktedonobacterales bacterium]
MKNALPWYRMYSEARTDAKLRALTDAEHRVWFHLLCFAAEQDGDGRGRIIGYDYELLAVELCDGDTALLRQTIERLKKLRILSEDENGITFCAFEKRQYDKPSDRPEHVRARVAAYRERQRQDGNANVTPGNAEQREREERDGEKENTSYPTVVISDEGSHTRESGVAIAVASALALVTPAPKTKGSSSSTPTPATAATAMTTRKPRAPDPLWDACVHACCGPDGIGPTNDVERGKWNKGLKALRKSGATPEEIAIRATRYKRRYGEQIALNPMALTGNWTTLATEVTDTYAHTAYAARSRASGNGRSGAGGSGSPRGSYGAHTGQHLPDAEEWREWARRERAAGRTIIGG